MNISKTCKAAKLVDDAKIEMGITNKNEDMTDFEVATALRCIAQEDQPDEGQRDRWVNINGTIFTHDSVTLMVSLALLEFPEYYAKNGLAQMN